MAQVVYNLHLLNNIIGTSMNAVCLDGSPGAFYYKPAANPENANNWQLFFQVCLRFLPSCSHVVIHRAEDGAIVCKFQRYQFLLIERNFVVSGTIVLIDHMAILAQAQAMDLPWATIQGSCLATVILTPFCVITTKFSSW